MKKQRLGNKVKGQSLNWVTRAGRYMSKHTRKRKCGLTISKSHEDHALVYQSQFNFIVHTFLFPVNLCFFPVNEPEVSLKNRRACQAQDKTTLLLFPCSQLMHPVVSECEKGIPWLQHDVHILTEELFKIKCGKKTTTTTFLQGI